MTKHFDEKLVFENFAYSVRGTFVDVGANRGTFTEAFARHGFSVVAFEPHPDLYADLHHRFANDAAVVCVQKAVSDAPGNLPFYASTEHTGIHSLAPFHPTHRPIGEVAVVTLKDELAALQVASVVALKIDVEGSDLLALRGFDFDRYTPELLMVEFMDSRSLEHFGYTHHDMAAFMSGRGYETWVSEWAPLVDYAREGEESPHEWRGFHRYSPEGAPAHGNLLFVLPAGEQRLLRAVRRAALQIRIQSARRNARSAIRRIPVLGRTLRAVKQRFQGR